MSTPEESSKSEALFTRDYILMCINNLSHSVAVNILMPVLPLYLVDDLGLQSGLVGLVLSMYAMGSFAVRPVSGYLSDTLPLKALFMVTGIIYAIFLPFYLMVPFLLLAAIRLVQGISFGIANTAQNTIAVGIIPRSKLGSGLGIYSSMTALGMVLGPMLGIKIMEFAGYETVFLLAFVAAGGGMLLCWPVKVLPRESKKRPRLTWSSMIFKPGIPAALAFAFVMFGYGMYLNYVSILARDMGPEFDTGIFYGLMGLGLIVSRVFGGTLLDKGYLRSLLVGAKLLIGLSTAVMVLVVNQWAFFASGFVLGMAFGVIAPSYQTIIVKMADASQWGAANSTFLIAMDLGMMSAMLVGGAIAGLLGYGGMFLASLLPLGVSLVWFLASIAPAYMARIAEKQ